MNEEIIIALVISVPLMIFLPFWAWKLWHGQWLRSIAGNQMVSDEEYSSDYQRNMGRRVAVVLITTTLLIVVLLLTVTLFTDESGGMSDKGKVLINIAIAVFVVSLVWALVKIGIDNRHRIKAMSEEEYSAEDRKIDRKSTVVLSLILAVYLVVVLAALFIPEQYDLDSISGQAGLTEKITYSTSEILHPT